MRPLAAPVVGGMLSSPVHILVVRPVIFVWRQERAEAAEHIPGAAEALTAAGQGGPGAA